MLRLTKLNLTVYSKFQQYLCNVASTNTVNVVALSTKSEISPKVKSPDKNVSNDDWFNTVAEGDIDERVVPKPVGYLPDHLPQVRRRIKQKPWWKFRHFIDINTLPLENEDYSNEPNYPAIFDTSTDGIKKQIRLEWYNAIRRLPSAEQKIYEITKHYGHLSYFLEPVMKQYNSLPIQQYITRTHLVNSLPEVYNIENFELDAKLKNVLLKSFATRLYLSKSRRPSIEFKKTNLSYLGFADNVNYMQTTKEEDILNDSIQIVRNFLSKSEELPNVQLDYNPFVGSSWWLKDFPIPFKKQKWFKEDTHDQCFLYQGTHALHMRSKWPLPQIVPIDHELSLTSDIPQYNYNLLNMGYRLKRHNILSLPGFWPDKSAGFDFCNLICHSRDALRLREVKNQRNFGDSQDVLDGMAITSSFASLSAIANNLGFTVYDQLTYPLVTQVIITDGQFWSFYLYQLNSHSFHSDVDSDVIRNLCWSSGELKLFDKFEDGTFSGINDDVLKLLVKFLGTKIEANIAHDLCPYLGFDERTQQEKDELSYGLRRKFANVTDTFLARRKKTNLWETIYKNHKDAPVDIKRIRPKIKIRNPPFFKM